MSAYAEWKAGMISDAEYAGICREEEYEAMLEERGDDYYDDEEDVW